MIVKKYFEIIVKTSVLWSPYLKNEILQNVCLYGNIVERKLLERFPSDLQQTWYQLWPVKVHKKYFFNFEIQKLMIFIVDFLLGQQMIKNGSNYLSEKGFASCWYRLF